MYIHKINTDEYYPNNCFPFDKKKKKTSALQSVVNTSKRLGCYVIIVIT